MPFTRDNLILLFAYTAFLICTIGFLFPAFANPAALAPVNQKVLPSNTSAAEIGAAVFDRGKASVAGISTAAEPQGRIIGKVFNDISPLNYFTSFGSGKNLQTVATNDLTSVSLLNLRQITGVTLNDPQSKAKFLFSFDNRVSWNYWNGNQWQRIDIKDTDKLVALANSADQLTALKQDDFIAKGGFQPGITSSMDLMTVNTAPDNSLAPPQIVIYGI